MNINEILKRNFGYNSFRSNQREIIETVIKGSDCVVLMPTGGGKSICYQIPALCMDGTAVVISPLISLMKDQVESLRENGIEAAALNSGISATEEAVIRRKCLSGTLKLIYISPEKLLAEIPYLFAHIKISLFAIDEAHCISHWGHDFRPEYTQLNILHERFPEIPIMALTATADKVTRKDIISQLGLRNPQIYISSFDRPNLSLEVKKGYDQKQKLRFIVNFIRGRVNEPGIIYCLSRKNSEKVASELLKSGINALVYHAGLSTQRRDEAQEMFKNDAVQVVCATIAFGMGIDKSNIRWIIHYNMPKSLESFYQEIGRAGRDGYPAETILFYSYGDIVQLSMFAENSGQKDINMEKLHRMQEYAESSICRRRILLNYFGEQTISDCGNCDNCKNPPKTFDGTILIQKALSAIARTKENIRLTTVIEILKGIMSTDVIKNGYDKIKTFGAGRDLSASLWRDYMLQMLHKGFIEIAYDDGNKLKITTSGADVLMGRLTATLCEVEKKEYRKPEPKKKKLQLEIPMFTTTDSSMKEDKELFEILRQLRLSIAKENNMPPYIVMSDKVLHSIATIRPTTVERFGSITGIGEYKKDKYGKLFTDKIKQHLNR